MSVVAERYERSIAAAHDLTYRYRQERPGEFMWPFVAFCFALALVFAIVCLLVFQHRQEQRFVSQDQAKRLAAVVLVQARQLRDQRAALLALVGVERINRQTVRTLMKVQETMARRQGLIESGPAYVAVP